MGKDYFDLEKSEKTSIVQVYNIPERLVAISKIFARAKKEMSLAEQKTFVAALSQMKFTEEAKTNVIYLDKKELADILGIHSDSNHLSVDVFDNIRDLPKHSQITIADDDKQYYDSGLLITRVRMLKNRVKIKFEEDYLPLFTNLSSNYITLWSYDIFKMTSKRSVQFYEFLRSETDTRINTNQVGIGVKQLKEMFEIPKDGKGSYMSKGHFQRTLFEKKVIEPLCEDLKHCKMLQLLVQPDGKYYEKVKKGNRVLGYRFYWVFSSHPKVATAKEVKEISKRIDENPAVLKVAKDIIKGENKPKKSEKKDSFKNFEERQYTAEQIANLEKNLRKN